MNDVKIILKIDNQEYELDYSDSNEFVPRIYKRFADFSSFENSVGDYTLSFKLPKSIRNISTFRFIDDVQNSRGFLDLPELEATVFVNNVQVLKGNLYVDRITPQAIEVTLISGAISWVNSYKDLSLKEVRVLDAIRFTGSYGTNHNPWADNDPDTIAFGDIWTQKEGEGFDIQFPILPFGNYSSGAAVTNPRNTDIDIKDSSGVNDGAVIWRNQFQAWFWDEFHPCIYLKTFINKLFTNLGYTVSGSFLDDPSTDNLIIPFVGNRQDYYQSFNWNLFGKVKIISQDVEIIRVLESGSYLDVANGVYYSTPPIFRGTFNIGGNNYTFANVTKDYSFSFNSVNSNPFTISSVPSAIDYNQTNIPFRENSFFINANGLYNIIYKLTYDNIPIGSRIMIVRIKNLDNTQLDYLDNTLSPIDFTNIIYNEEITIPSGVIDIDANVNLQKGTYKIVIAKTFTGVGSAWDYISDDSVLEINPLSFDEELVPEKFLPDVPVNDFLRSIIGMFNLFITANESTKVLSLDYYGDTVTAPSSAIDLTSKCDIEEATIERAELFREVIFNFSTQDDEVLGNPEGFNRVYFPLAQGLTEVKEIDILFQPTFNRQYSYIYNEAEPAATITLPTISVQEEYNKVLGEIFDGSKTLPSFDRNPRILRYETVEFPQLDLFNVGSTEDNYNYNYYNSIIPQLPLALLAGSNSNVFGLPLNITFRGSEEEGNNLFDRFYKEQLEKLSTSIILELPVYLTEIDIERLNLKRPVLIQNQLYAVLEVLGYNPSVNRPTKIRLLKL